MGSTRSGAVVMALEGGGSGKGRGLWRGERRGSDWAAGMALMSVVHGRARVEAAGGVGGMGRGVAMVSGAAGGVECAAGVAGVLPEWVVLEEARVSESEGGGCSGRPVVAPGGGTGGECVRLGAGRGAGTVGETGMGCAVPVGVCAAGSMATGTFCTIEPVADGAVCPKRSKRSRRACWRGGGAAQVGCGDVAVCACVLVYVLTADSRSATAARRSSSGLLAGMDTWWECQDSVSAMRTRLVSGMKTR